MNVLRKLRDFEACVGAPAIAAVLLRFLNREPSILCKTDITKTVLCSSGESSTSKER